MPAPLLTRLAALTGRVRPRPCWWLGRPHRITIAPAATGGYVLKVHHSQGTEWVALPVRARVYDRPDVLHFAAASEALTARRLRWVLPWELDADGNLTAPVTPDRQEARR
jgi:hypothetical protein